MAVDEFLLRSQIQKKDQNPILRFYRFNDSAVTVGYGIWRSITQEKNYSTPLIRRITGGGMVLHGQHDLTYSLIVPLERCKMLRRVRRSYFLIHDALKKSLQHFRIPASLFEKDCANNQGTYCFDSPVKYDVMLSGKKIAGAGQKRTLGYLLHQGSIAWGELTQASSHLSESDFYCEFSTALGNLFGVQTKEIEFVAEELKEMAALA